MQLLALSGKSSRRLSSTRQNEHRQDWGTHSLGIKEKAVVRVKKQAGQMLSECNYFNVSVFSKFHIAHTRIAIFKKKTHTRNADLENKELSLSPTTQGGTRFTASVTAGHGGEQTDRHGNYKRQKKARAGRQWMFSWPPCWAGRQLGAQLGGQAHHTRGSASHWSYPSACPGTSSAGCHLLVSHCVIHLW